MDWTMVGALGEAAGAVAVVASLLYVGRQVRQNNRIARAEAYRDVTMGWAKLLHLWADDPPAANVLMEVGIGTRLADLPKEVQNSFLLRVSATFRVFETIYQQVAEGILDAEALDMLWGQSQTSTPMFGDAWNRLKGSYSPRFRAFVEGRFDLGRPDGAEPAK
ncbi:MAG: hypothetical protein OEO79_08010 [Gemmatimonadota bacterium]|nr:hypothetical protein [Gemmatimonadota bacterium]MDH3422257.1 hypothetical protein [Gemmatimonadota bacterium]